MLWEYESAEPCGAYDAMDRAISSLGYRSPTGPEVGQVYACLYLNPWPDRPYGGALTKLPNRSDLKTVIYENLPARRFTNC